MAEKRMFSKAIIDSDAFLDMPQSTQLLYFHLSMRADDDGFVNNPKRIMVNTGCRDDDMNVLIAKNFVIQFGSGVIVIRHWRINNVLRSDRYTETQYKAEKATLSLDENKAYFVAENVGIPTGNQLATTGCHREEENRVDKSSIDKSSIGKGNTPPTPHCGVSVKNPKQVFTKPTIQEIADYCHERANGIDPEEFFAFYESKGWVIGKQKMKD